MEASPKQIAAVKRTFTQLQEDAEHASPEALEAMNEALEPHADIIAKVVGGVPVTKWEVSPVIGALFDIAKAVSASASASKTPGIKNATRIITNRYAKTCACGAYVAVDAGFAASVAGKWITVCQDCAVGKGWGA